MNTHTLRKTILVMNGVTDPEAHYEHQQREHWHETTTDRTHNTAKEASKGDTTWRDTGKLNLNRNRAGPLKVVATSE